MTCTKGHCNKMKMFSDAQCFHCLSLPQADLNCNIQDDTGSFYGVTSQYESPENMTITCSTKVCSFGKQVVEKVEVWTKMRSRIFFTSWGLFVCFTFLMCAACSSFPSDWICTLWKWTFCLPDKSIPHVWIHDQLHP